MAILRGVWKQHLRPRVVVGYGVKIFLPSPPNYVTRSPGCFLEWGLERGPVWGSTFCTVPAQDVLKSPVNSMHEPSINYRKHN